MSEIEPHTCKTCTTTLTNQQFDDGKMCCDKPMFHDDHDEDEEYSEDEIWFNENYPNASCHRCDVALDGKTVVYCKHDDYGQCETWYCDACHEKGTDDCPIYIAEQEEEEREKKEKIEEEKKTISYYATDNFNPELNIFVTDDDCYGMTLKEAVEKLIICDDCIIFKKSEPAFQRRHGTRYQRIDANLYNLLNRDMIIDAPDHWYEWMSTQHKFYK